MVSVVLRFSGEARVNWHEETGDRNVARAQSVPQQKQIILYKYSQTDQSSYVDYNQ